MNSPAAELLAELGRRGIELRADAEHVCFRPRSALTPELVARVKAHKAQLLTLLTAGDRDTTPPARRAGTGFSFSDGQMEFGDICAGWRPMSWAQELHRKADRCDAYQPDIADYYRRWAGDIERRLEEQL
jgi:hypothetical protein